MSWPGGDDLLDLSSLGVILDDGEQVLWSGRPTRTPLVFRWRDLIHIPLSLMWGGFAQFWSLGVISARSPGFLIFGLPFLVAGAYLTVGRFAHNWFRRYRTTYLLTDRRAIIAGGGFGKKVWDHQLAGSRGVQTRLGRNGTGTIVFEAVNPLVSVFGKKRNAWGDWSSTGVDGFQFYRITDVETAIRIVRSMSAGSGDRRQGGPGRVQQVQDTPGWSAGLRDDPAGRADRSGGDSTGRPAPSPWPSDPAIDPGSS